MKTSDKINLCIELAKLAYTKHNDRRAYEWKVTLGLWAVILASIGKNIAIPLYVRLAVVFLYGYFWLLPLWTANNKDKLRHDHYTQIAANLLRNPHTRVTESPDPPSGADRFRQFRKDWAMKFHFFATLFLALAGYFIE